MPPLPPAGNVISVNYHYTFGTNSNVQNRHYFRFTGTPVQTDMNALATAAETSWTAHLAALLHTTLNLVAIETIDLSSTSGHVGSWAGTASGTNATGPGTPANVALVVSMLIGRRYRGGHPRWYQVGLLQSDLADEDHIKVGTINAWTTAFKAFSDQITAFTNPNLQMGAACNVSYVAGHTWAQDQHANWHKIPTYRGVPVTDNINAFEVKALIGTQRRRVK